MNNKETLKEVKPKDIQRIIASTNAQTASIEILQLFTQLQAKRRYSEEDLMEAWHNGMKSDNGFFGSFKQWFEQFKKK